MKKKLTLVALFTVYQFFIPFVTSYLSKGYARHYTAEAKQLDVTFQQISFSETCSVR
ncbi:hypothetical protein K1X76_11725 [bacterium]|nr:hypothetical protein [bacterium]